jgi:hypothetical protein
MSAGGGESTYCGLDCGLLLDQLDEILKHCQIHAKYDPVFAPKMVQKLIDRCNEVKSELMYDAVHIESLVGIKNTEQSSLRNI